MMNRHEEPFVRIPVALYNRSMKMSLPVKTMTAFFLVFFLSLLFSYANAEERMWKLIGKSRTDTCWYVDPETISQPSDVVSVWVKSIPEKVDTDFLEVEERTEEILKKIQARNFGDYEFTEALWELDCSKTMYRILYFCAYNKNGDVITSSLTPDAEWLFILPESAGGTIKEAVCKR